MKKYDYYLGENYLKTKKNLYCIKTYNMIGGSRAIFDIYQCHKTNRFNINSMAINIFKTEHIGELSTTVCMYQVNDKLHNAILKRLNS